MLKNLQANHSSTQHEGAKISRAPARSIISTMPVFDFGSGKFPRSPITMQDFRDSCKHKAILSPPSYRSYRHNTPIHGLNEQDISTFAQFSNNIDIHKCLPETEIIPSIRQMISAELSHRLSILSNSMRSNTVGIEGILSPKCDTNQEFNSSRKSFSLLSNNIVFPENLGDSESPVDTNIPIDKMFHRSIHPGNQHAGDRASVGPNPTSDDNSSESQAVRIRDQSGDIQTPLRMLNINSNLDEYGQAIKTNSFRCSSRVPSHFPSPSNQNTNPIASSLSISKRISGNTNTVSLRLNDSNTTFYDAL